MNLASLDPTPAGFARLREDPSRWRTSSEAERLAAGEWLRDRFFALSAGAGDPGDETSLRALLPFVEPVATASVDGLSLSFHPTARFKAVRFLDAQHLDASVRPLFARPSARLPHLAAAFADPAELSLRTFENIVPLDRLLERTPLALGAGEVRPLGAPERPCGFRSVLRVDERTRAALLELDALGLYAPPIDPGARGGERFVFHSARLAEALTRVVLEALPEEEAAGFRHVNPVFRCNRFAPGDRGFHSHRDTPYYDAARHHVSRRTLLLYLTGGTGAPALRIADEATLEAVEPMTCVVFDQRLEHEGGPYADGPKIFLRTELVYEDASVVHEPGIARIFARAVYLTGESLFAPELAAYAREAYERAAAAHWRLLAATDDDRAEPFVHKRFSGVSFVANGYDYWFPAGSSVIESAAIAVLDVLNCRIGGEAFRARCTAEVVRGAPSDPSWIARLLARQAAPAEPAFVPLDKDALLPPPEEADPDMCCDFHRYDDFDPTRCGDLTEQYEEARQEAAARIFPAQILAMGQEIFVDPALFAVRDGRVHVLADAALEPVNFAACWNSEPVGYLTTDGEVETLHLLVPPIPFDERHGCLHLTLDLFRNSWMVGCESSRVPVPVFDVVGTPHDGYDGFDDEDEDEDEDEDS